MPHAAQVYLNLVLEFVPETVFRISKHYSKSGQRMPTLFVKLYVFQVSAPVWLAPPPAAGWHLDHGRVDYQKMVIRHANNL